MANLKPYQVRRQKRYPEHDLPGRAYARGKDRWLKPGIRDKDPYRSGPHVQGLAHASLQNDQCPCLPL